MLLLLLLRWAVEWGSKQVQPPREQEHSLTLPQHFSQQAPLLHRSHALTSTTTTPCPPTHPAPAAAAAWAAGQEYVWARVFAGYGVEVEELKDFFAGPGFAAWQRMGNIQGYGGPLPLGFMEHQAGGC